MIFPTLAGVLFGSICFDIGGHTRSSDFRGLHTMRSHHTAFSTGDVRVPDSGSRCRQSPLSAADLIETAFKFPYLTKSC